MSVEFEPVKLGPRHRRVDPVAVGALVVVIGLVAAVLKPWDAGANPGTAASDGVAVAAAPPSEAGSAPAPSGLGSLSGPRATAGPEPPRTASASTAALASWDDVRTAVRPHDAWGIRTIVAVKSLGVAPARQRFAEVWDPIPNDSGDIPITDIPTTGRIPTVDVEPNDRTVVAIGITFPASHMPLDTRIWLVHPDRLEWVDAWAMGPDPAGGAFLYQFVDGGDAVQNWDAGRYRVDVLVDGAVHRVGFTLPNRFEIVPRRPEPPVVPDPLVDPQGGALPHLPLGLFVTVAGVSIPLPAEEGPALDEAGEWLNVDPGTGRPPRSFVAAAFLPAATGLGVMLPPGSVVQEAAVRRLAPEPLPAAPELVDDLGTPARPPTANVLYRAPGGGAWPPGVYRISVVWADSDGLHDRSWHLELLPGPGREQPSLLSAARDYARYSGASGVVLGATGAPSGEPGSDAIRLVRAEPGAAAEVPARDRVSCDGFRVEILPGIVGLAHPVDAPPLTVTARVLFEFIRADEQPVLTAAGDVPGLTLIALAADAAPSSDVYRYRLGDNAKATWSTICFSVKPAG